jgi:cell division septal protein FtsQ
LAGAGDPPEPGRWLRTATPLLETLTALPAELRARVARASLAGEAVTLHLAGGPEVRVGRAAELEAKAAALAPLLAHLGNRPVLSIDVRVPSAPAVAPVPDAAGPSPGGSSSGTRPRD